MLIFANQIKQGLGAMLCRCLENKNNKFLELTYINSNINRYIQRRQQSLDMQFPMRPADYPFLSHLSFLDATEIGILSLDELTEYLKNGRCQRVGEMSAEDMEMLLHSAQESNLFTRKEKDTFLKI